MFRGWIGELADMPWTPRNREPREVRELQRLNRHLEHRLGAHGRQLASVQSELDDYKEELQSQERKAEKALSELNDCKKELQRQKERFGKVLNALNEAEKAEEASKERHRQQTELLSRCRHDLDISIQENSKLAININKLQQQTGRLSNEEVKGTMGQLYHDLNLWTQRHFLRPPSKDKSLPEQNVPNSVTPMGRLDAMFHTQTQVSLMLFKDLLRHDRIATFDQEMTEMFDSIEQEVQDECMLFLKIVMLTF